MRKIKVVLCGVLLVVTMVLTGCSNVVRATVSESEFLTNKPKISTTVALNITDEFRNFEGEHVDWWCDATAYTMEIGPLATDWFQFALESQFESVSVSLGQPKFPYANPDVDFIVTPKFTSFDAGGPVVVKLEKYWVELEMSVIVQDAQGKILETLELKEKGAQGGTPGYNPGTHVYPEVCRKAVKPLVDKTIKRLAELSNSN